MGTYVPNMGTGVKCLELQDRLINQGRNSRSLVWGSNGQVLGIRESINKTRGVNFSY